VIEKFPVERGRVESTKEEVGEAEQRKKGEHTFRNISSRSSPTLSLLPKA